VTGERAIVYLIDNDVSIRAKLFPSAQELMSITLPDVASCVVSDIRLPEVTGIPPFRQEPWPTFRNQLTKEIDLLNALHSAIGG